MKVAGLWSCTLLCAMLWSGGLHGQKGDVSKGDRYYKERAYQKAITEYEIALRHRFRVATAQKLANAYRLTNGWVKAEALLDSLVTYEKVNTQMWFLYGEALMYNGQYDKARDWFLKYAESNPEDSLALQRADACLYVHGIMPALGEIKYDAMPFNSEADDHAAVPWLDGIVFTSDRSPGFKLLTEKSSWTGRNYLSLFFTKPLTDSTWATPELWSSRLNDQNINSGYVVFAKDSASLWFTRNTLMPNDKGLYTLQLYNSKRIGEDRWSRPEEASFAMPAFNMLHPALSPDGRWLAFASDRPGGEGGLDIWLCERNGDGWSRSVNAGPTINTAAHDAFPFFSIDGRLFFASKGHIGFGGYDIFYTSLDTYGQWQNPVNLGPPINSPLDDITFYMSPDGASGFFSSTRNGGDDDIYYWYQASPAEKEE